MSSSSGIRKTVLQHCDDMVSVGFATVESDESAYEQEYRFKDGSRLFIGYRRYTVVNRDWAEKPKGAEDYYAKTIVSLEERGYGCL